MQILIKIVQRRFDNHPHILYDDNHHNIRILPVRIDMAAGH